jgi:hypothetical protein
MPFRFITKQSTHDARTSDALWFPNTPNQVPYGQNNSPQRSNFDRRIFNPINFPRGFRLAGIMETKAKWQTKKWRFRTLESAEIARAKMNAWLEKNKHRIQYQEIFVNNAYAIEYRKLRRLG